jgi:hypothetical protein
MNFDIIGIGGLIVGIIGILVGIIVPIYFYRKSLRPKLLAVAYRGPFPLMLSIPGVTVTYLGAERKALSRTYILFWNRGTNPIEHTDFAVPIAFPDTEVLTIDVIRKDPMALVKVEGRTIKVELLRPSEAAVVQVEMEKFDRPNLIMPTKTQNMIVTIRRIPGILGLLPGALAIVTGVLAFAVGAVILEWLNLGPENNKTIPFIFSFACIGIAFLAHNVGSTMTKQLTPRIPYRFLTADSREAWIEKEEKRDDWGVQQRRAR